MKHILALVAIMVGLIVAVSAAYLLTGRNSEGVNAPRLLSAAHAYEQALRARNLPVPDSVTVQELIETRFLAREEVKGFDGLDVTINLKVQNDPKAVLLKARLKNGEELILLTDGSVQQVPKTNGVERPKRP